MSQLKETQHLKIPFEAIQNATDNFKTCIGGGGYGPVYKGQLLISGNLTTVAVKRLYEKNGQGSKEFLTEIELLKGQNHPNLISLLGYCDDGYEKIIVYEYAERGSLDKYIRHDETSYTLSWLERLKICVDIAHGLDHLHNHAGKHQAIIHRDIKSANVLLDHDWVAKISDLGLAKLSLAGLDRSVVISHACGTLGYTEPEYMVTGIVKRESDVFSFGVVLLEILCGRMCNTIDEHGLSLSDYHKKDELHTIVDPNLLQQMSQLSLARFLSIANGCLHQDRKQRHTMSRVVKELKSALEIEMHQDGKKSGLSLAALSSSYSGGIGYLKGNFMSSKRISNISPGDPPEPLEIRIIRKWTRHNKKHEKAPEMCYLFVDAYGDAIEAIAEFRKEEYVELNLQSCYTVDKYVSIPARTYMPAVQHQAALKIGKMATFTPLYGKDLPTNYYNFASYTDLPARMELPKLLTDYIGRIENVTEVIIRSGKRLREIKIQDERQYMIKITLWEEKADQFEGEGAIGKVLAITGARVTKFKETLQLESTAATTAIIDPPIPDLQTYIDRFKDLGEPSWHHPTETQFGHFLFDNLQKQYTRTARITDIQAHRNWYYVLCSECTKSLYPQRNNFVCEDHGVIPEPKFKYCVNTIVIIGTKMVKAVFFSEAMNGILNISCRDMVITQGNNRDPKILPEQIRDIKGMPVLLRFKVQKDRSIVVNEAENIAALPPTPDPKMIATKRPPQRSEGTESSSKRPKN